MMEQYIEIKAANPDCLLFYRMGDFYELFFEDAEIASRALGIVLTKRGKHLGRDIPMCGVPIERSDEYLHKLIAFGHRVAVCEQLEDPAEARKRGSKSVVKRDVVRLVTPGTLTEDSLLDARRNNYLLAVARARTSSDREPARFALAWIDISTGEFRIAECEANGALRRDRAHRAGRDHGFGRALCRCRNRALSALARPCGAAGARRVRRRHGRAAAGRLFRGRDHRQLRRVVPARTDRRRRLRHLCRAHADRQTPAALSASARGRRRHARHQLRDPRQSRIDAHALRRAARIAARNHRPHHHRGRIAAFGATAGRPAHRSRRHRPAARRRRLVRGGSGGARRNPSASQRGARSRACPHPACIGARRPARSGRHSRRAFRRASNLRPGWRRSRTCRRRSSRPRPPCGGPMPTIATELAQALADELPACKRDGGFVREGYDAALDEARALARPVAQGGRRIAGALCRGDRHPRAEDPPQQRARLFRGGHCPARRQAAGRAAQCPLHPSPDTGGPGALHHHRARRAGSEDRQRRRPCARHRA